ncbi:hypothetical protein EVAR_30090_1 [Eumeta japonica]|uniref:Uncharacterized protein n=1 Tax=Eumeta variegata TaxID=151549 RepID=A0A4C1X7R0_EUMVA|nr:hypothetical protein EVAR_30090_1 [Eumeta japonica]
MNVDMSASATPGGPQRPPAASVGSNSSTVASHSRRVGRGRGAGAGRPSRRDCFRCKHDVVIVLGSAGVTERVPTRAVGRTKLTCATNADAITAIAAVVGPAARASLCCSHAPKALAAIRYGSHKKTVVTTTARSERLAMDRHCSSAQHPVSNNTTSVSGISFALQTIGITSTILTLTLLLLTCALHREWRQTFKNQLLVQLMISRFLHVLARYVYDTALMLGHYEDGDTWIRYDVLSFVYTELVVSSWMFVFTKNMYDDLVKVITVKKSHRLLKASLGCWLAPLPPSLVGSVFYTREPSLELYLYFLYCTLKWPILIANGCILLKIIKSLRKDSEENKSNRKILRDRFDDHLAGARRDLGD